MFLQGAYRMTVMDNDMSPQPLAESLPLFGHGLLLSSVELRPYNAFTMRTSRPAIVERKLEITVNSQGYLIGLKPIFFDKKC